MAIPVAVDLAHLPPFHLGPLLVEPALRRLAMPEGEARTIQPLAMRLLIALAEAEGEPCSRDDLILKCWNARIVGDDAIHRVISTLRRDLALLSGDAVAIETIPKVGYRLRVDAEPPGADRIAVADPAKSSRPAKQWLAAVLIAVLASAGLFATTRASSDVTAIAVVADAGAVGADSARFADGLTGDLARLASTMPSLAFVEPGGAQARQRLLLRVTLDADAGVPSARVRLVDRQAGAVVWSREFAGQAGTVSDLRARVAYGVAGVVQCGLDRSAVFDEPVSLRLYLGACDALETRDWSRARAFAHQLTELRPNAPAGWACLATTTIPAASEGGPHDHALLERSKSYAERALALDPNFGLAYQALAMVRERQGKPVLAVLEKGIRVDPDYAGLQMRYAMALLSSGYVKRAVEPALRAIALEPHDPGMHQVAFYALLIAGRDAEAAALGHRMQRLFRGDPGIATTSAELLTTAQDPRSGLLDFQKRKLTAGVWVEGLHEMLLWRVDPSNYDWDRFDRIAQRAFAEDKSAAWSLSFTAARMSDRHRALQWLARAPAQPPHERWAIFDPEAAAIRRDPKFFEKMAGLGLVGQWQSRGRWPDFCTDPGLGYDCPSMAENLQKRSALRMAKMVDAVGFEPTTR